MKSPSAPINPCPSNSHSSPALVGNPTSGEPQCPYTTTPNSNPNRCEYQRCTSFFIEHLSQLCLEKREYASALCTKQHRPRWQNRFPNSLHRRIKDEPVIF